jgi:hypothetical protein
MVWRDEHKDAFVSHMLDNETALQSFRNSIRNQEHQSCYKHFLDSLRLLLMPLVGQQDKCRAEWSWAFPWPLGMTQRARAVRDYKGRIRWNKKHNQPLLSCNNSTLSTAG